MIKRISIILAILAFTAGLAQATTHFQGKVQVIKGDTIVVKADFAKIKWVKDGQNIKLNKKIKGIIFSVDKEDSLVTVVVKKTAKVKVGDKVDIKKARRALTGC